MISLEWTDILCFVSMCAFTHNHCVNNSNTTTSGCSPSFSLSLWRPPCSVPVPVLLTHLQNVTGCARKVGFLHIECSLCNLNSPTHRTHFSLVDEGVAMTQRPSLSVLPAASLHPPFFSFFSLSSLLKW